MAKGRRANLETLLRSAWERQHHPANASPAIGHERSVHTATSATVLYLRASGAIGVVLGLAAMMATKFFWPAAVGFYLGFLLWEIDLFFERTIGFKRKLILGCLIAVIPILFTREIVLFPATVEVSSYWNEANYPNGSDIEGIKWEPGRSELRVAFRNPTDRDYDAFELIMQPSDAASDMKEVTDIPCTEIANQVWSVSDTAGDVFHPLTKLGPYRYRCDGLPKNSTIQFLLAIVNVEQAFSAGRAGKTPPSDLPFGLLGVKRKPQLIVHCTYRVVYRPHSFTRAVKVSG